jgi:hypothetical protein
MPRSNLIGKKFGALIVVSEARIGRYLAWECQCACGGTHVATTGNLNRGDVTNCGCLRSIKRQANSLVHGHTKLGKRTKEYRAWAHIKGRCTNPNDKAYLSYGGRGIGMHHAWVDSFETFLSDIGEAPSPSHSVDRYPNNDGNYEPGNVRWATAAEQNRNTRRTVLIDGIPLVDYCQTHSLSYDAIQARIRRGHPIAYAVSPLTGHAYRAMLAAAPAPKAQGEQV